MLALTSLYFERWWVYPTYSRRPPRAFKVRKRDHLTLKPLANASSLRRALPAARSIGTSNALKVDLPDSVISTVFQLVHTAIEAN